MKNPKPGTMETFLAAYGAEILRWNRQINLVSRQDTETLLPDLFAQSRVSVEGLWALLRDKGWIKDNHPKHLRYFDLGSGGGIPGAVWHRFFASQALDVTSWLVEPREKRAWFLERVASLPMDRPFAVSCQRWGETGPLLEEEEEPPGDSLVIISLKALHLEDSQVLAGLAVAASTLEISRAVIARFYPEGQVLDPELVARLGVPDHGTGVAWGPHTWTAGGAQILPISGSGNRPASLILSLYNRASN